MTANEEEIELYKKVFSVFDLDGNGTISVEELDIGLRNFGMVRRQASVVRMIDEVDNSNDHALNFDGFLELIESNHLASLFEGEMKRDLQRQQSAVGLKAIYGQTPTPSETEEYVQSGLERLQMELDAIGDKEKNGLNQALKKCPHLIDDKFLLMFLRTEVFHARRAAQRLVKYWNKRIEIFGEAKAFMRLTLDEALADDSVVLSLGIVRPTGKSDPCGRGIVFIDFSQDGKAEYTCMSRIRADWYALHVALEDEKAQKEGIIFVCKTVDSLGQWDVKSSKMIADHIRGTLPIRVGCFHSLHPRPIVKIIIKVGSVFLGKKLRNRIRLHKGTHEEVLESTATYGIPTSAVPDFWGGELKYESWQEWLETRRVIENGCH